MADVASVYTNEKEQACSRPKAYSYWLLRKNNGYEVFKRQCLVL